MIGIVSFGGYIPKLRLDRMSIYQQMGWLMPATVMVAQGERSVCNWDEDSLTMAVSASMDCLEGIDKNDIDALFLASTTLPFSDRSNAGIVATALNLRADIQTADYAASLKAGTTALLAALERAKGGKTTLVTASDNRQARAGSFYEMWFGDGAASLLVGEGAVIAEFEGAYSLSYDFVSHYRGSGMRFDYTWEERWIRDEGYAKFIPEAINGLLQRMGIGIEQVDRFIYPCFFKREHVSIGRSMGIPAEKIADNLHEACGETGSAHPLVMLVLALQNAKPGERLVICSFGQGCDALSFRVTEHLQQLPPRLGIQGSLENKRKLDNYLKFLKFRDLIDAEVGIRAEAPDQTALTTLWRNRKMILGLVGGKCTQCGTPQFPKAEICVNPECGAFHSQEEYEFANRAASIKSFTGDMLAVSQDPPAIYGMVQFEGGGRLMADFTDCTLEELKVGMPVKMVFRRHYVDKKRGFTAYFWKATPLQVAEEPQKETAEEIRFDGQVAIVTGAGGGLGRIYALELARRGAKVVVNDLGGSPDGSGASSSPAESVVQEIIQFGGTAIPNFDSVASPQGAQNLVDTTMQAFGRIDILINNAGILRDKSFTKMSPDMWHAVLDVHLNGAFYVTHPVFQIMRQQGYGRIVFTTSAAGLFGNFGQANYAAAKMGILGLMNTLKIEGEKYNIKLNTVAPLAATRLTQDVLPNDLLDQLKPEFVAPLVLYLCSDKCTQSGLILNAGMGYYGRAAIVSGDGIWISKGGRVPTLAEVHRHWQEIERLEPYKTYPDANTALMDMLTPKQGAQEAAPRPQEAPAAQASVASVFQRLPQAFQPQAAAGLSLVFQFSLSGTQGGEWHAIIQNQECTVQEGKHPNPTTTIKMSAEDFLEYVSGKLNAMQAYSSGRLKIEGDLMKSQLIGKLFKF